MKLFLFIIAIFFITSTYSQKIEDSFGEKFQRYVQQKRIERIADLPETPLPIDVTACHGCTFLISLSEQIGRQQLYRRAIAYNKFHYIKNALIIKNLPDPWKIKSPAEQRLQELRDLFNRPF